jgi:phospholipid/cholesterol/gamma-HCH transport system ATP-binding protein
MDKILEVKNIHKAFGDKKIHQNLNFHLNKGESIALLGNSGTGKSVLLRSLIGLEDIDQGEIYFNNQRIDHLSEEELYPIRTKISYAFQSGALFDSETVFDNLAYPLREHSELTEGEIEEKVKDALELVGMKDTQNLMPADLSGGMQKRVGLARSFILGPDILLYDEPTAGLDPVNVLNVVKIMRNLQKRGISSIFVTHDIPAALEACDRILILNGGKIEIEGTPQEMLASDSPLVKSFFSGINPKDYV